jgi:hypothetical protein
VGDPADELPQRSQMLAFNEHVLGLRDELGVSFLIRNILKEYDGADCRAGRYDRCDLTIKNREAVFFNMYFKIVRFLLLYGI